MQKILLEPHYLPGIRCFKEILEAPSVVFNTEDLYQKQSFRNRCHILSANGLLALSIPVQHPANKIPFREIRVELNAKWAREHWVAIKSAYQKTPYFHHFAEELEPLITQPLPLLWEHNIRLISWLVEKAGQVLHYEEKAAAAITEPFLDRRNYWHPKTPKTWEWGAYPQVFDQKFGFQPDLSILDFLFNMGH